MRYLFPKRRTRFADKANRWISIRSRSVLKLWVAVEFSFCRSLSGQTEQVVFLFSGLEQLTILPFRSNLTLFTVRSKRNCSVSYETRLSQRTFPVPSISGELTQECTWRSLCPLELSVNILTVKSIIDFCFYCVSFTSSLNISTNISKQILELV